MDASGAERKAQLIKEAIAKQVQEGLKAAQAEVLSLVETRVPTIDQEYDALMAEDGGTAAVPRSGDRSADRDGRIRLQKPEDTYLQNAVVNPLNYQIEGTTLRVLNRAFLNACTFYSYFNKRRVSKDEYVLSDEHRVGPYLTNLLKGGSRLIQPVFRLLNGHQYPLQPSDDPSAKKPQEMTKSFKGYNLFETLSLADVAKQALTTALAELNRV